MDKAKVDAALGQVVNVKVVEKEAVPSSAKEEAVTEEELSTAKRESLSSGDFVDLGFDVCVSTWSLRWMSVCV